MATEIRISEQKFYDQLNNGDTFSSNLTSYATHLKGCAGSKIRLDMTVEIGTFKKLRNWQLLSFNSDTQKSITMSGVNWREEGFNIGDGVTLISADGTASGVGTVLAYNGDELFISKDSGTWLSDNDGTRQTWGDSSFDYLANITNITALNYKYGLIENGEDINFLSPHTQTEQLFKIQDISTTPSAGAVANNPVAGNKAWANGQVTCEYLGTFEDLNVNSQASTWKQFRIIHDFIITPFYLDGEKENISGNVEAPDRFLGTNSLKYVFSTGFLRSITDPNTERVKTFDLQDGSVAYYGESFNGNPNRYSISNLSYYDTTENKDVDRFSISNGVLFSFYITQDGSAPFLVGQNIVVGMANLKDVESYRYSTTLDWEDTFTFISARATDGAGGMAQDQFFNYFLFRLDDNTCIMTVELRFSADQQSRMQEGDDYVIFAIIQDDSELVNESGQALVIVDVNQYSNNSDITGLYDTDRLELFAMPNDVNIDGSDVGFTNGYFNIEEGIDIFSRFWIDNALEGVLTRYSIDLVCVESTTGETFTLRSIDFDLSDSVMANGVQYIALDDTRNYILKEGNQFNYLKIVTDNKVGTKQYYNVIAGMKMPWQSWKELIGANEEFFNLSKSFYGLNNNSSNYNDIGNWELKIQTSADLLKDSVTTTYIKRSERIYIYDYDSDETGLETYDCSIGTYDRFGNNIEGNIILSQYTELRGEFIPLVAPTFTSDIDFTTFSANGNRFAHGNRYYETTTASWDRGSGTVGSDPNNEWENQQADDLDLFNRAGTANYDKKGDAIYTTTTSSVLTTANSSAFYGMFSERSYENYDLSGEMYSTATDDDVLSFIIAFYVDSNDIEHTLSLCATTGGIDFGVRSGYISGDVESNIFDVKAGGSKISPRYALVYNLGKEDAEIIEVVDTGEPSTGWSSVGDLVFNVVRTGKDINITVSWLVNGTTYTTPITYDLTTNSYTDKFLGSHPFGFGFLSQDLGGFKNVSIVDVDLDYYGFLRIQPKESNSDESMTEINSFRESPTNNLLIQKTGDEVLCEVGWNGTKFIVSGLVNSSNIDLGAEYKLSTQIGKITNS